MTWFVRPLLGHTPLFEQELEILSLKPVSAVKCWITEAGSSELGLASTFKRLHSEREGVLALELLSAQPTGLSSAAEPWQREDTQSHLSPPPAGLWHPQPPGPGSDPHPHQSLLPWQLPGPLTWGAVPQKGFRKAAPRPPAPPPPWWGLRDSLGIAFGFFQSRRRPGGGARGRPCSHARPWPGARWLSLRR